MKTFRKVMVMIAFIAATVLSGCSHKSAENAKIENLNKTALESFSSIRLEVDVASVDIIPEASGFAVEFHIVNQNVSYSVKNGVLKLTAEGREVVTINNTERSYIKIYVPEDCEFTEIDCRCDVGAICIGKIKADNISIDTDVGNVTLLDIEVKKELVVDADVGNAEISLTNPDCSYDISAGVGKVVINGAEYSELGVKKSHTSKQGPKVQINTGTGSIRFSYKSSSK